MTVCGIMWKDDTFAMMSDTMVLGGPTLPRPDNITAQQIQSSVPVCRLTSKYLILEDPSAMFAFSGIEEDILAFARDLPAFAVSVKNESRPMRLIGDQANRINEERRKNVVGVIGHYFGSSGVNHLLGISGMCKKDDAGGSLHFDGSGTFDLIKEYEQFQKQSERINPNLPQDSVVGVWYAFVGNLNAQVLFAQNLGRMNDSASWGGFIEVVVADLANSFIASTPDSVYVSGDIFVTPDGVSCSQNARQYHYASNSEISCLRTLITAGNAHNTIYKDWPIARLGSRGWGGAMPEISRLPILVGVHLVVWHDDGSSTSVYRVEYGEEVGRTIERATGTTPFALQASYYERIVSLLGESFVRFGKRD